MQHRIFFALLLSFSITIIHTAQAQDPLPKWMTPEEEAVYEDYRKSLPLPLNTTPPDSPPRTPGEYEEAQAVIITWASYSAELREIVRHAQSAVTVYIINNNQSWVENFLVSGNVPLDNIVFVQAPFNSVWVRDYGPQSVYLDGSDELAFIDWDYNRPRPSDNQIPDFMAAYLDLPIYQMALGSNLLTATGGNFMADGFGRGFSSKLILAENPTFSEAQIDQVMHEFKGIHTYVKMDELPYDNISHLDMHMKLLDEETLLVGEFPEGISDGPFIEANLEYLTSNYQTHYGRDFNVVRVPMAPSPSGNYPPNAHYRTYTNSIILNHVVLVPTYGSYLDDVALSIYQEAMPGYEIVGINMNNVISASGAIHCVTREIAAEDPILIAHARLHEADHMEESFEIKAAISNQPGIDQARVYWTTDSGTGFDHLDMELLNDTFYAHIPVQPCLTDIAYYISATNVNGKTITKPPVAPNGYYTFTVTGEETDFYADKTSATVGETVTFHLTYCQEPGQVDWHFGHGAEPATATGIGPHQVVYNESGAKTVEMIHDGESLVKEGYVLVNDENSFIVYICTEGQGTTQPPPGEYQVNEGEELEVSAQAEEGWEFVHWLINDSETHEGDTLSLEIDANVSLTAIFQDQATDIHMVRPPLQHRIYPNPNRGQFTLSLSPFSSVLHLQVMDMQGMILLEKELSSAGWETLQQIDIGHAAPGVYLVRMQSGKNVITERVIVQ